MQQLREPVLEALARLGIAYEMEEHPPMFTTDDMQAFGIEMCIRDRLYPYAGHYTCVCRAASASYPYIPPRRDFGQGKPGFILHRSPLSP